MLSFYENFHHRSRKSFFSLFHNVATTAYVAMCIDKVRGIREEECIYLANNIARHVTTP